VQRQVSRKKDREKSTNSQRQMKREKTGLGDGEHVYATYGTLIPMSQKDKRKKRYKIFKIKK